MEAVTLEKHHNGTYLLTSSTEQIGLHPMGAQLLFVRTTNGGGQLADIALPGTTGPEHTGYAGRTIVAAGRIANGQLEVKGRTHLLATNDGPHTLHGGPDNASHRLWKVQRHWQANGEAGVRFVCLLPHGENGFPGNRLLMAEYRLTNSRTLTLRYTATTDQPTYVNLTNHVYWNLSGDFLQPCLGTHQLHIHAQQVFYNNAGHVPQAVQQVAGTPFDFTRPTCIADAMQRPGGSNQLKNANGYNNTFLLETAGGFSLQLCHPASHRRLAITTSYPALVFYSGGYLPVAGSGLAFEAQHTPGAPPYPLLPGHPQENIISYQFDNI